MLNLIKTALAVILAVLLTLGAVYNRTLVELSIGPVFDTAQIPLYLLAYGCLGIGFLIGLFYGWLTYGPIGRWNREREKQSKENLRNARKIVQSAEREAEKESRASEREEA